MDIDERRKVVSRYLRRCVTYSDASITRKKSRGEDPNEIAMVKPGAKLALIMEHGHVIWIIAEMGMQDLERNLLAPILTFFPLCTVHTGHAAGCNFFYDSVLTELVQGPLHIPLMVMLKGQLVKKK